MEDIRSQLTKLTLTLSLKEPRRFASQQNLNPVSQTHQVEASSSETKTHEQVQVVIIHRSGKIIEKSDDPRIT